MVKGLLEVKILGRLETIDAMHNAASPVALQTAGLSSDTPSFLSLFSGCGGLDLGFLGNGYRCLGAFDISSAAISTYKHNIGKHIFSHDLSKGLSSFSLDSPDVLLAGSPCQGFSLAGKREVSDPRNELLLVAGTVASQLLPKVVVVENVPGVLSGDHKEYWLKLTATLQSSGYTVEDVRCEASVLGIPQQRGRLLKLAWRSNRTPSLKLTSNVRRTLGDVLSGVEKCSDHNPASFEPQSKQHLIAQRIGQGQKLCNVRSGPRCIHTWNIPEVFGTVTHDEVLVLEWLLKLRRRNRQRDYGDADPVNARALGEAVGMPVYNTLQKLIAKGYIRKVDNLYDLTHTFNGKYRRLELSKPSRTVDTRFGDPRLFLHPTENRGFSVREAARVQGFPDDFEFQGTDREKFVMVGNAVPPPVAAYLAKFIRETLL